MRLSAFADEISPDLSEQLAVLRSVGIHRLDLRSLDSVNVLSLSDRQLHDALQTMREAGVGVGAIGSPLGKVDLTGSFEAELDRLDRAISIARLCGTAMIRVFSFYLPPGADPATCRDEVLQRLTVMARRAGSAGITLVHENEKGIYGDTVDRCLDIMTAVDHPALRAVLDPANFIQCGEVPYPDAYRALEPWIVAVHVKDARPDGTVVPVGQGAGRWPELVAALRQDGFTGDLSLEPHLASAGRLAGFSGPERFRAAVRALEGLLRTPGAD